MPRAAPRARRPRLERRELGPEMVNDAIVVDLDVVDRQRTSVDDERPVVGELTARFGVEERALEHDESRAPASAEARAGSLPSNARANGSSQYSFSVAIEVSI